MNPMCNRSARVAAAALALSAAVIAGCGKGDTRVNSDPGPGKPSRADGGDAAVRPDPNRAQPAATNTTTAPKKN